MLGLMFTVLNVTVADARDTVKKPKFESAWARETAGASRVSAIYGVLRNLGPDDALLRVEVADTPMAEFHETFIDENGIMQMDKIENGIALKSGTHVMLQPGGKHIMLMGLSRELQPGDELALTLHFEKAGRQVLRIPVKPMRYLPKDHIRE